MASITGLNQGAGAASHHDLYGRWWLQGSRRRTGGRLTFNPHEGGRLVLAGSLGAPESGAAPSVIFGTTLDNQRVTLMQPSLRSWGGTHDRRGQERRNREEWGTFDVLVGGHFRAGASTEFNTIEFTTDHLAHWVARPRPTIDHVADEGRSVSVSLEIQEPVRSTFSGAEVNVEWSESANYGTVAATAVLEPRFVVRVPEGITLEAAWDVYITPLLFLMTLATGSAQSIRSLNAGQAARQPWRSSRASVLPNRWGNVPDLTGDARHWEFPLPFHQIEPRFAEVVPSWLELFGNERLALVEFFSVPFTPGLFLEDSFARTVRAIELWHRGRHGGEWMSPQEFEELRAHLGVTTTRSTRQARTAALIATMRTAGRTVMFSGITVAIRWYAGV